MKNLMITILMMVAMTAYSQEFTLKMSQDIGLLENLRVDIDKPVVNPERNNYAVRNWVNNFTTPQERKVELKFSKPKYYKPDIKTLLENITTVVDKDE